jgi:hypothetical protein
VHDSESSDDYQSASSRAATAVDCLDILVTAGIVATGDHFKGSTVDRRNRTASNLSTGPAMGRSVGKSAKMAFQATCCQAS